MQLPLSRRECPTAFPFGCCQSTRSGMFVTAIINGLQCKIWRRWEAAGWMGHQPSQHLGMDPVLQQGAKAAQAFSTHYSSIYSCIIFLYLHCAQPCACFSYTSLGPPQPPAGVWELGSLGRSSVGPGPGEDRAVRRWGRLWSQPGQ